MFRVLIAGVLTTVLVASGGITAQDAKKEVKKDDPVPKAKGFLPQNFGKLGLTDTQKQDVYNIQAKYNTKIDEYEAKIRELKTARDKEVKAVLTPEQKKRLEEILLGK
jgi:Spy/CpxP family protein refolding chaperone